MSSISSHIVSSKIHFNSMLSFMSVSGVFPFLWVSWLNFMYNTDLCNWIRRLGVLWCVQNMLVCSFQILRERALWQTLSYWWVQNCSGNRLLEMGYFNITRWYKYIICLTCRMVIWSGQQNLEMAVSILLPVLLKLCMRPHWMVPVLLLLRMMVTSSGCINLGVQCFHHQQWYTMKVRSCLLKFQE